MSLWDNVKKFAAPYGDDDYDDYDEDEDYAEDDYEEPAARPARRRDHRICRNNGGNGRSRS